MHHTIILLVWKTPQGLHASGSSSLHLPFTIFEVRTVQNHCFCLAVISLHHQLGAHTFLCPAYLLYHWPRAHHACLYNACRTAQCHYRSRLSHINFLFFWVPDLHFSIHSTYTMPQWSLLRSYFLNRHEEQDSVTTLTRLPSGAWLLYRQLFSG